MREPLAGGKAEEGCRALVARKKKAIRGPATLVGRYHQEQEVEDDHQGICESAS